MHLKITPHLILITCWIVSIRGKALYPNGCYECEEEMWEEIPCEEIPLNSTTVSVPHFTTPSYKTTTSTQKPLTTKTKTTTTTTTTTSSTTSPVITTTKAPYQKCYCQCKVDCKEFCRKVIINPPEKQIAQLSKRSETAKNGRLESTHILQRELIPNSENKSKNYSDYEPSYEHRIYEASTLAPPKSVFKPKYNEDIMPAVHYYTKPSSTSTGEPIHRSVKGGDKSYVNGDEYKVPYDIHQPPPSIPQRSQSYNCNSKSNSYDFSLPFENILPKAGNYPIPIDTPNYKLKNSNLQDHSTLNNGLNYDDSFDSLIKEFLNNMPSNEIQYESFS